MKVRQGCAWCGGEKPAGKGRRLCDACNALPKPPRRWRGRDGCQRCGGEKTPGRGKKLCDACAQIVGDTYKPDPCANCGGPKPPGIGRRLCDDCVELARWKKNVKKKATGRKPCLDCGGPKGPGHRRRLCDACQRKREQARVRICEVCGERPSRYPRAKLCAACKLESEERRRAFNRERNRRYRQEGRFKSGSGRSLESHRMAQRLRRERSGEALRPVSQKNYEQRYGRGMHKGTLVPTAPLRPHLRQALVKLEAETGAPGATALSEKSGVSEKRIREIADGRCEVAELVVDRLCAALDLPMSWLYQEDEAA